MDTKRTSETSRASSTSANSFFLDEESMLKLREEEIMDMALERSLTDIRGWQEEESMDTALERSLTDIGGWQQQPDNIVEEAAGRITGDANGMEFAHAVHTPFSQEEDDEMVKIAMEMSMIRIQQERLSSQILDDNSTPLDDDSLPQEDASAQEKAFNTRAGAWAETQNGSITTREAVDTWKNADSTAKKECGNYSSLTFEDFLAASRKELASPSVRVEMDPLDAAVEAAARDQAVASAAAAKQQAEAAAAQARYQAAVARAAAARYQEAMADARRPLAHATTAKACAKPDLSALPAGGASSTIKPVITPPTASFTSPTTDSATARLSSPFTNPTKTVSSSSLDTSENGNFNATLPRRRRTRGLSRNINRFIDAKAEGRQHQQVIGNDTSTATIPVVPAAPAALTTETTTAETSSDASIPKDHRRRRSMMSSSRLNRKLSDDQIRRLEVVQRDHAQIARQLSVKNLCLIEDALEESEKEDFSTSNSDGDDKLSAISKEEKTSLEKKGEQVEVSVCEEKNSVAVEKEAKAPSSSKTALNAVKPTTQQPVSNEILSDSASPVHGNTTSTPPPLTDRQKELVRNKEQPSHQQVNNIGDGFINNSSTRTTIRQGAVARRGLRTRSRTAPASRCSHETSSQLTNNEALAKTSTSESTILPGDEIASSLLSSSTPSPSLMQSRQHRMARKQQQFCQEQPSIRDENSIPRQSYVAPSRSTREISAPVAVSDFTNIATRTAGNAPLPCDETASSLQSSALSLSASVDRTGVARAQVTRSEMSRARTAPTSTATVPSTTIAEAAIPTREVARMPMTNKGGHYNRQRGLSNYEESPGAVQVNDRAVGDIPEWGLRTQHQSQRAIRPSPQFPSTAGATNAGGGAATTPDGTSPADDAKDGCSEEGLVKATAVHDAELIVYAEVVSSSEHNDWDSHDSKSYSSEFSTSDSELDDTVDEENVEPFAASDMKGRDSLQSSVCSQEEVPRLSRSFSFDTGTAGFNSFVRSLMSRSKKAKNRKKAKENLKVSKEVKMDHASRAHVSKAIEKGIVDVLIKNVYSGEGADIYVADKGASGNTADEVAIKIIKDFQTNSEEQEETLKKLESIAEREYKNLRNAYKAGVTVPKTIARIGNVLFIEFLGKNGMQAPKLRELDIKRGSKKWTALYCHVLEAIRRLYTGANLIHGSLDEYSIMVLPQEEEVGKRTKNKKLEVALVGFGRCTVDLQHPLAWDALAKDLQQIQAFFSKKAGIRPLSLEEQISLVQGKENLIEGDTNTDMMARGRKRFSKMM